MSIPDLDARSAATRQVIDSLFAAAATGVTADVLEWWHVDGYLDDVTIARRFAGHDQLYPYLEWYYRALPDLDFTPARIIVSGDLASVEWAERCHLRAPFDGVAADGRELRLRAIDLFGIRDGKVAWESSWYGDAWMRRRLEGPTDGPDAPPPPSHGADPGTSLRVPTSGARHRARRRVTSSTDCSRPRPPGTPPGCSSGGRTTAFSTT